MEMGVSHYDARSNLKLFFSSDLPTSASTKCWNYQWAPLHLTKNNFFLKFGLFGSSDHFSFILEFLVLSLFSMYYVNPECW